MSVDYGGAVAMIRRYYRAVVCLTGSVLAMSALPNAQQQSLVAGGHGEPGLIAHSQVELVPASPEPPAANLKGDPALQPGAAPATRPSARPAFKVFIATNGLYQTTSNTFTDGATFHANAEDGRFDTKYSLEAGPAFDVSGSVMISSVFGIGVGVSRFSRATSVNFSGSIPHPFFFGQSRVVTGDVSGLKREELAVHVQAKAVVPAGQRIQLSVFAGPSLFRLKQDTVVDFDYADSYPYDQASFKSPMTTTVNGSKLGFNGGADVAFFFSRQVGLGFTAQLSKAVVSIKSAGGGNRDVKAGGVQTGGGLRLRF